MRAIVCREYGPPEVLKVAEVPRPTPGDDEVLLAVRAAGVNPLDSHMSRGRPFIGRLFFGLRRPKDPRCGRDVAGVVEEVGRNVTDLAPGDAVFGACRGAFAELACAQASSLVRKPANVSFAPAGAVAVAGYTALQGLRDRGRLQAGQKVLVHAAAGGVGSFAVQIAKALGAETTGVASAQNLDLVRSLGADDVIDRGREDFTRLDRRWDLILDCWANRPLREVRRALAPGGAYVAVGGPVGSVAAILASALGAAILTRFTGQRFVQFLARANRADLETLRELLESGKLTPFVDRTYRLEETAVAVRHLGEGHARGKVVVTP